MNNMLPRPRFWQEAAEQIKTFHSLFGELMIYLLLSFLAYFGQSLLVAVPTTAWMMATQSESMLEALNAGATLQSLTLDMMERLPDWMTLVTLAAGGIMGVVTVIYCRKFQHRTLASMGLRGKGRLKECLLGFGLGLVLLGAVLGLGLVMGGYRLGSAVPKSGLVLALLTLPGCVIYGASLELLTRGYYAPTVGARTPVGLALLLSTLASAMMQTNGSMFSLAVANHLLLGLVLGIWVLKRGNIWGACAMHAAWIFGGNYLFHVAPADSHAGIRLFDLDADPFRPLLSGGEYGVDNSICTTLILLAAVAAVLALKPKDAVPARSQPAGDDEQQSNFL